jgi:hypothetical protein
MTRPKLPEVLFGDTYGGRAASANPRGHGQQSADILLTCSNCRENKCPACPDKLLLLAGRNRVCTCKREGHDDAVNGEPRRSQFVDPISGDIYGPGGIVAQQEVALEYPPETDSGDGGAR